MSTTNRERLQGAAKETFGWDELHAYQLEAMEHVLEGHDVLAVLPTGAGKSAIYQVPALLVDGPALVVSPLLALQHDQVEALTQAGAPPAVVVNSTQSAAERQQAWDAVEAGEARFVFMAPEQLAHQDVVERLRAAGIALFVIDEAHCVSSWGHDFRPDYLRMRPVIERLGHPPVVALTATAAQPVRDDIVTRLGLRDVRETVTSFDRPNLRLAVVRCTDADERREALVSRAAELVGAPGFAGGGLVYTASRAETDRLSTELTDRGLRAMGYHAGLRADRREEVHQAFRDGDVDVVVATSAFGMGIDKPDIRFVLHAAVPDSLDSYYQQIGRAGRDGELATTELFHRGEDLHLQTFLTAVRAPEDVLRAVSQALLAAAGPVRLSELTGSLHASRASCTRAVNLLEQVGAVRAAGRGRIVHDPDVETRQAVADAVHLSEAHQELIRSRVAMMGGYADTTGCRRQFLLGYFGEQLAEPCGHCDNCEAGTAEARPRRRGRFTVQAPVTHEEWGPGVVMSVEDDRLTVLFEEVGYRTLSVEAVEENDLLTLVS
ncbi:RecQ family ATP-dependent DNA helicase [Terrabacter sp. NPDC080008]|uniref:RecQ family ATP-dependent DNA helicase n=1 Tax=Terrabacter sp. NPDC080008 TaxID=3155176 RepID=UPI00344F833B